MKLVRSVLGAAAAILLTASSVFGAGLEMKPLAEVVHGPLAPAQKLNAGATTTAARIAWGADVATVQGELEGIYAKEGLKIKWATINALDGADGQIQQMIDGKLHFGRLTLGQAIQAAPAFEKLGTGLTLIVKISWSAGGDTIDAIAEIKTLKDLEGKPVATMLYGPHPEYLAKMLADAKVDLTKVKIVWKKNIMQMGEANESPLQALRAREDGAVAATLISPEVPLAVGAEGIPGVHKISDTKQSPTITADCYFVRDDFFKLNRDLCYKFFRGTLKSMEATETLSANQANEAERFTKIMTQAAKTLLELDDPTQASGALGDCVLSHHEANRSFFTGRTHKGETDFRSFSTLQKEIQGYFTAMGLITKSVPIKLADWDFDKAAEGLKFANRSQSRTFDTAAIQQRTEERLSSEASSLDDLEGLISREIYFAPGEVGAFDASAYIDMYDELIRLGQTHAGVPVEIIGCADPSTIDLRVKLGRLNQDQVKDKYQELKNDSMKRANVVLAAFLKYCADNNIKVEPTQYVAVGAGVKGATVKSEQIIPLYQEALRLRQSDRAAADKKFQEAVNLARPNRRVVFQLSASENEASSLSSLEALVQ